jgi:hypothetical protein
LAEAKRKNPIAIKLDIYLTFAFMTLRFRG